jgi:hypothetical protein
MDSACVSDLRHALAAFFPRVGPNWVQYLRSKHRMRSRPTATLLSVRQVSELLGVSTAIVYRLCERRELVHVCVSHAIGVSLHDLAAYLKRQRVPP